MARADPISIETTKPNPKGKTKQTGNPNQTKHIQGTIIMQGRIMEI